MLFKKDKKQSNKQTKKKRKKNKKPKQNKISPSCRASISPVIRKQLNCLCAWYFTEILHCRTTLLIKLITEMMCVL